jgi:hypothetical protein
VVGSWEYDDEPSGQNDNTSSVFTHKYLCVKTELVLSF